VTERDQAGIDLLLSEPEFLAWLEPQDGKEEDEPWTHES
jgi:hypothetical protein